MKKVFMIAHQFPPIGGSGVQRTVKFIKYLPGFGWEGIVLTVKQTKPSLPIIRYLRIFHKTQKYTVHRLGII